MRLFNILVPVAFAALLFASLMSTGPKAMAATALGVVGTVGFLYGTWVIVQLASGGATSKKPTLGQTVVIALALLLKLPLIYAGWVLSQRLGPFAPAWFLAGLALVYCALVWRTVLAVRD